MAAVRLVGVGGRSCPDCGFKAVPLDWLPAIMSRYSFEQVSQALFLIPLPKVGKTPVSENQSVASPAGRSGHTSGATHACSE